MSLSAEATNATTGTSGSSVISKDLTIEGNMSSDGAEEPPGRPARYPGVGEG